MSFSTRFLHVRAPSLLRRAGAVLAERSKGSEAWQCLKHALDAYHSALQIRTRDQLPQGWAKTQNNLGIALRILGERSEGSQATQYLQQAVDAYRSALQVRTREQLPQDWAETQINLGVELRAMAERSEGTHASQYLQQAVDANRNALQIYTESAFPTQWIIGTGTWQLCTKAKKDWVYAYKCYELVLSHDPTSHSKGSSRNFRRNASHSCEEVQGKF